MLTDKNDGQACKMGSGPSGPRYTDEVPLADIKRWFTATFWRQWQTEWNSQRTPHMRRVKQTTRPWTDLRSLKEQRIVSRLRTGHSRLSYNMGGSPFRIVCTTCAVPSSVEHVICVCPQYEAARIAHGISGGIREVLSDDSTKLAALIGFIKDAGLYHQI